jgi:HPt (histidine-containing phosphotransfer) domain-containing protein
MVSSQQSHTSALTVDIAWDENKTIERMGGHKPLIEKLVTLFLRDTPEQLQQALAGIEAHDYEASYIPMHSLKGTSSNFCTKYVEPTCADLLVALKDRDWAQALIAHKKLTDEYLILELQFKTFLGTE